MRGTIVGGKPDPVLATLGGAVATILAAAILYGAPAAGLPLVDIPALVGGVLVAAPTAAFWLGFTLFFLSGWLVMPLALAMTWTTLPGPPVGVGGALLRGLVTGIVTWLGSGVLLGVLGALQRVADPPAVGFFALGVGWGGALVLLVVHLAYGIALAVIASMSRGLSPVACLGWVGHGAGRAA